MDEHKVSLELMRRMRIQTEMQNVTPFSKSFMLTQEGLVRELKYKIQANFLRLISMDTLAQKSLARGYEISSNQGLCVCNLCFRFLSCSY